MGINITDELKTDFLVYAQEVNNNRAFPDVRDGLKISQRACLWAMYDSNYSSSKPHVKSAKVDGEVLGKFSPHGSQYLTMVRMSQPWLNNLSLINFHGANGSLLGGPEAAASRYTEIRLDKIAEDNFFSNIKKDTVDFILNYSEDIKWPGKVLPSIAPLLLVNGSSGIGYTIAQDWLPHNLNEVFEKVKEYVSTGKISTNNIYPDFPIGCTIINKKDCEEIYKTGKGSVILRGKTEIVDNSIKIIELPYQVYAEAFIQSIKDLVNNEQISGIEDICNKSGDDGLLIEIECSVDPKIVLNKLYKLTDLQTTFNANQMALVDGIPQMLNLQDYIKVYVDHNINCLKREYKFDLDKAISRLEVVSGLIEALSSIDSIIALIKQSKSSEVAKQALIDTFNFTAVQAAAIVDLRLGKLANLEKQELIEEQNSLNKIIEKCNRLLNSKTIQKNEFLRRLEEFVNKYGWQRRTEVIDVDLAAEKESTKAEVKEEEFKICLTKNNTLKKISIDKFKAASDDITHIIQAGAKDRFILISANGTMYKLPVNKIDTCTINSTGMDIRKLIDDSIIAIYTGKEVGKFLFFVTKKGYAKKVMLEDVFNLSKNVGAPVMKVVEGDEIFDCRVTTSEKIKLKFGGKEKIINTDDFLPRGRTAGGSIAVRVKQKQYVELF